MPAPVALKPAKSAVPSHLGKAEAELYAQVCRAFDMRDEVSLAILEEGLSSLQRCRLARETIDRGGMVFEDKGRPKAHPLLPVERDSRAAALQAFKQLGLELPHSVGSKRSTW
jgi:hypothetical protein